jgi:hypothetical protein
MNATGVTIALVVYAVIVLGIAVLVLNEIRPTLAPIFPQSASAPLPQRQPPMNHRR